MKRATILCLCLFLSGTALAMTGVNSAQSNDDFTAFWQRFKAAVVKGDKEAVVGLSRFPIRMPRRVRNIKDAADLRLRYREVFNKNVNAAKCFATEQPTDDPDNAKGKFVSCFDNLGDLFNYEFEHTGTGWRFVRLCRETLPD
jgi:hypothetical protein